MKTIIGLVAALFFSLLAGGAWGIYKAIIDFGLIPAISVIGGTGLIAATSIIILGENLSSGGPVRKPFLSTIAVFTVFFMATCLIEGLLYYIYLLISS
jgi:hypothetical protein